MSTTGVPSDRQEAEVDQALDLAEAALDRGDPSEALSLCIEVLNEHPDHPGAMFITAEAYRDMRELDEAEHCYRKVLQRSPAHASSWSALGTVLFDRLEFEQARSCLLRSIRLDPLNAEAYYWRAMLRERRDDLHGARRDYLRAARLDPVMYPMPVELTDAMVEAVVEDALRSLHPSIRVYLAQVPIILEEVPEVDVCYDFDPPAPPAEILGYFSGYSLEERSLEDPWSNLPSAIVLFRCNLQRIASDREHLLEELRVTVFHEVGHYLGLDESDLEQRGLD